MSVMGAVWVGWVPSLSRQQTLEGRRGDLPEPAMSGGSLYPAVLGGPECPASGPWPPKVGAGMSCSVLSPAWGPLAGHAS